MSRVWVPNDVIAYNLPASGAGPVNFAWGTILCLVKLTSDGGWASLVEVEIANATDERAGIIRDNGNALCWIGPSGLLRSTDAGTGTSFTCTTADGWCLYGGRKANGAASPTLFKYPIGGSLTTRTITATATNAPSLASGFIRLGGDDDFASMKGAMFVVLPGVVLSDTDLGNIMSALTTASVVALASADGWVVDDSDAFATNLVASNTNRTSDSGTADDAVDDPAGWVYGLGGGSGSSLTQNVDDTASVADTVGKAAATTRAESLTLADDTGKAAATTRADTLTVADNVTPSSAGNFTQNLGDTLTAADAVGKLIGPVIADTATITDTGFGSNAQVSFDDALTVTDSVDTGGSSALSKGLSDTLSVADQAAPASAAVRALSDTLTAADQSSPAWAAVRAVADTASLADNVSTGASTAYTQNVNDAVVVADSLGRAWDALTAVSDAGAFTDGVASSWGATQAILDVLSVGENIDGVGAPVVVYVGRVEPVLIASGRVEA